MKYFFDTEFIENGGRIDLLSIGIVAEDGREYYVASSDCDLNRASSWVRRNVIGHVGDVDWKDRLTIAREILEFIGKDTPEFWAYYADYDWICLVQLYGPMMNLPKGWPMYCRDLKQLCDSIGNPELPIQTSGEHNALEDARWARRAFDFLKNTQERLEPERRARDIIRDAIEALEFYAAQKHMLGMEDWESVSGEPENWVFPDAGAPADEERTEGVENGGIAHAALRKVQGLKEETKA